MIQEKYNEEEYAKQIEQHGFLTERHNYELVLLVKYWKKLGIKPKQRKEKLYEFCKKYIVNFNDVLYFKQINTALKKGGRKDNPLIIIDSIPITNEEIEYINNLDIEYNYKKILFVLLVEMKTYKEIHKLKYGNVLKYNYISGNQNTYNEILEVSKMSNNKYKINAIINELEILGLVDVRMRGKINLVFMNNIKESEIVVFEITTFDNIGYYFDLYNGDPKIINCNECGKLIKATSNRQKFCRSCWREKEQGRQREKWHKYKDKYRPATVLENP